MSPSKFTIGLEGGHSKGIPQSSSLSLEDMSGLLGGDDGEGEGVGVLGGTGDGE